jgi:hypothetical protein
MMQQARIGSKTLGTFATVKEAISIYARAAYYLECKKMG